MKTPVKYEDYVSSNRLIYRERLLKLAESRPHRICRNKKRDPEEQSILLNICKQKKKRFLESGEFKYSGGRKCFIT
ncbi:MAG: hypothetical protein ABIA63_13355 [bacterium]